MATQAPPPNSAFLAPRYWPTWLGIGLLSLAAWLPFRLRMAAGTLLGHATRLLARERRYITETNLRLCFPELSEAERAGMLRQTFVENGIGLIETASGWIRPPEHFRTLVRFPGKEVFAQALAQGRGVVLLGAHYSTLDFSANLLSLYFPFAVTYRAHKNPLFDAFMLRGRLRNCNGVFDRKDIRGAFRHLKAGKMLWYAPDQDYGPDKAVYAPFFGQPAATITAGSRFAAINQSPALIVSHRRLTREKCYVLEGAPLPDGFPSGDDVQDATLINRMLEAEIRKAPAQYLWMHKRFKTRPGGKPESPYILIRTRSPRLTVAQAAALTQDAAPVAGMPGRLQLPNGKQLWSFPGLSRGLRAMRHPALQLDHLSKLLRVQGMQCVTVDNLFRLPHENRTLASVFLPPGDLLAADMAVPPAAAATLLLALHRAGMRFKDIPKRASFYWTGTALWLADPLELEHRPGTTACVERVADLRKLALVLGYDGVEREALLREYRVDCRPSDQVLLDRLWAGPETP